MACIENPPGMKVNKVYYMPSALQTVAELKIHKNLSPPGPLLIRFECGFCPVGLFFFLIVELLKCSDLRWRWCDDETQYSNMVAMTVGKQLDIVRLIDKSTFYEIWMEPDSEMGGIGSESEIDNEPYHKRCLKVKECINESLLTVKKTLNYEQFTGHKFAFFCPRKRCKNRSNNIAVEESSGELKCLACKKLLTRVPDQVMLWYGKQGKNLQIHSEATSSQGK